MEQNGNESRKRNRHGRIEVNFDTVLVIKLPDLQFVRILSRSMFLAVIIVITLPCLGCIIRGFNSATLDDMFGNDIDAHFVDFEFLDLIFQDLAEEGLPKMCNKALIVGPVLGPIFDDSHLFSCNEVALVLGTDLDQVPSEAFDITFAFRSEDLPLVDRVVKVGGVVVTQLSESLSSAFQKQSNYAVVYLRRYNSTIVVMKKSNLMSEPVDPLAKRRLFQLALDAKKAALKGLEDVLLEPPREGLGKARNYLKKFNFLPDLLGDSLKDYPRRVFLNVGSQDEKKEAIAWFNQNYPSKNQEFELFNIQMVPEVLSKRVARAAVVDVSGWLMKNVKEDDFVVMKAEAGVVEEMIKKRTTGLVDELFLECENQWQDGEGVKKSKMAYWECLALYGRLRDEGIAVHQWWG